MNDEEWDLVRANLFEHALQAVEPRERFRWHRSRHGQIQTHKRHSSQALAIDVFGYLKVAEPAVRNTVLNGLAAALGLPPGTEWSVDLEWVDPQNRLNEKRDRPTQVDALATSEKSQIVIECKLAECQFASCSQTGPIGGRRQCNGWFVMQTNPLNGAQSRCALSGKGIRYWDMVPEVFDRRNDVDHTPCPFSGDLYQWMRNAVLCQTVASDSGLKPGFVVMYAEHAALPPAQTIPALASEFSETLRPGVLAFATKTYQQFLREALVGLQRTVCKSAVWERLICWVDRKVDWAAQQELKRAGKGQPPR